MKKILVLITALMIGLSFECTSVPHTSIHTKKENKGKMYRTSPRENGKYYAIESSYDGGKTWHSTGDSSPTQEEANKKMENMKNGLTTSGLTHEEAKASIPEGTPTIGDSDQNSKTKSTKKENKGKMYRVSPSKNGNYYVVECSYDGGKTWNFVDSSIDLEEANRKMEYLKKGLTTSGLTQEEAKDVLLDMNEADADSYETYFFPADKWRCWGMDFTTNTWLYESI